MACSHATTPAINSPLITCSRSLALPPRSTPPRHASLHLSPATRRAAAVQLLSASVALLNLPQPVAAEAEFETYLGLASPPTSYGGYGGNAEESPKYSFLFPAGWKVEKVNKVQKGTQGVDCVISNPRNKEMRAFVIALGRAGEDDKSFRLTDVDSTFAGFAGADYELQDALVSSTDSKKGERDVDGRKFFDYDITSPSVHYLSTVTVKDGKVFALFIKSPAKAFGRMEEQFREMMTSFKTL